MFGSIRKSLYLCTENFYRLTNTYNYGKSDYQKRVRRANGR